MDTTTKSKKFRRFNRSTGFAEGMARIEVDEFVKAFDYRTSMDKGGDVILLYNNLRALPDDERIVDQIISGRDGLPLLSAEHAIENMIT